MKKLFEYIITSTDIGLISWYAVKPDVSLSEDFWKKPTQRMTIVTTNDPKPKIHKMGGNGLLNSIIIAAMNRRLDKCISQTDLSWYHHMPANFRTEFSKRKIMVHVSYSQIENNDKCLKTFMDQDYSDRVLVLRLEAIGIKRYYCQLSPTSEPEGYCILTGELIQKKDNIVLWRHKAEIGKPVQGKWSQPPDYLNVTQAITSAINSAKEEIMDSFFSGH